MSGITHPFVSGVSDGPDPTLVKPSDWNAGHAVDSVAPSGLTGSTAASRYVGATTTGAPTTGAHLVGDWIVTQDGIRWTCTTAGTPGVWTQEPGTGGGGGTPASTVTGPDAYGDPAVVGTATEYARADHDHGLPSAPASLELTDGTHDVTGVAKITVTGATVGGTTPDATLTVSGAGTPASSVTGPDALGAAPAVGTGTDYARDDHDHGLPLGNSEVTYTNGAAGATQALDWAAYSCFDLTLTTGCTISFSSVPSTAGFGTSISVIRRGAHAITWPVAVTFVNSDPGGAGPAIATIFTTDGGTTFGGVWAAPGIALSSATPLVESGSGSAGTGVEASRADHVHPTGGGGGGIPTGTSMPGGPSTNQLIFRTDLGLVFYYDGTRWVSLTLYTMELNGPNAALSAGGTFGACNLWEPTYVAWLVDFRVSGYVGATNTGSAYWGFEFRRISDDTSLAGALNTSAASANGMWSGVAAIGASSTALGFYAAATKTSTPSDFTPQAFVTYRIIGT